MTTPNQDRKDQLKVEIKIVDGEWQWLGYLGKSQLRNICEYADKLNDAFMDATDFPKQPKPTEEPPALRELPQPPQGDSKDTELAKIIAKWAKTDFESEMIEELLALHRSELTRLFEELEKLTEPREGVLLWRKSMKPKKTLENRDRSTRDKLRAELRTALATLKTKYVGRDSNE
jgi:hypothetical protein